MRWWQLVVEEGFPDLRVYIKSSLHPTRIKMRTKSTPEAYKPSRVLNEVKQWLNVPPKTLQRSELRRGGEVDSNTGKEASSGGGGAAARRDRTWWGREGTEEPRGGAQRRDFNQGRTETASVLKRTRAFMGALFTRPPSNHSARPD
ncbi:hypothetical protein MHYP_G00097110 [Metynnis hypsauchen]